MYSSVDQVIAYCGATPDALGMDDESQLEDFIAGLLDQVGDFINRDRNQDFRELDTVPPVVHNIAMRMAGNIIRMAERQRNRSVVTVQGGEGGTLQIDDSQMFTAAIKADIKRIPVKPKMRMATTVQND